MVEKKNIDGASSIRKIAEEKATQSPDDRKVMSPEETQLMLHELRVHQIELEIQNEELRKAHDELDDSRLRYFELYDLAPVGYCTVSEKGLILEANLTAAIILNVPRGALVKTTFSQFILEEDQDIYYLHRKQLLETLSTGSRQAGDLKACEIRMLKKDGTIFWAHLTFVAAQATSTSYFDTAQYRSGQAPDGAAAYRIVIFDITERKRIEAELKKKMDDMERFHKLVVGRELTMIELKKEVNALLKKSGQEEKYKIVGGS